MKTILRTITILFFASLVSVILYFSINGTTTTSANFSQQHAVRDGASAPADGQFQGRPDGGDRDEGAGGAMGMMDVLITLAKLTGITALVLVLQKGFSLLQKRIPAFAGG